VELASQIGKSGRIQLFLIAFIGASLLNLNLFIACGLIIGFNVVLVMLVASSAADGPGAKRNYDSDSDAECESLLTNSSSRSSYLRACSDLETVDFRAIVGSLLACRY
jgi:hypothetical protein